MDSSKNIFYKSLQPVSIFLSGGLLISIFYGNIKGHEKAEGEDGESFLRRI